MLSHFERFQLSSLRCVGSRFRCLKDFRAIIHSTTQPIVQQLDKHSNPILRIAIVGRPNTGKSTLFNRLTKSNLAMVSDVPGTTRDRKDGKGNLAGLPLHVVDTGGLDDRGAISLDIQAQVENAIISADVILFMLDGKVGINSLDQHFSKWLRRKLNRSNLESSKDKLLPELGIKKEMIVLVNKTEGGHLSNRILDSMADAFALGLGDPIPISATHGEGMSDLANILIDTARRLGCCDVVSDPSENHGNEPISLEERTIQMSIMGKPNVGKSSLLNAMLGEERVITGPTPGLTRDSIHVEWEFADRKFRLVDTAGLTRIRLTTSVGSKNVRPGQKTDKDRKIEKKFNETGKIKVIERLLPGTNFLDPEEDPSQFSYQVSELALASALNALRFSQVVVLVVEGGQQRFSKLDLQLARKCLEEGRALVVVANKRDLVALNGVSGKEYEEAVKQHCQSFIRDFGDIKVVSTSAIAKEGIRRLLTTVIDTHDAWSRRISTWVLNKWIKETMVTAPTPRSGSKAVIIKYMTQVKSRPPTFALFCSVPELPGFFETFLRNRIQHDFQLEGVPVRFLVHKSKGLPAKRGQLRQGKHSVSGAGKKYSRSLSPGKRRSHYELMKSRSRRDESRRLQGRLRRKQNRR